jgi:hypothetical protein
LLLLPAAFLALSVMDLCLTWNLLELRGARFYEANPIAAAVLAHGGWWGLAMYKLLCAGTVLTAAALLARWRPRAARKVLVVACAVVAAVVGYSLWLVAGDHQIDAELARAERQGKLLEARFEEQKKYSAKLRQLAGEIVAGRSSLRQATHALLADLAVLHYFDPLPTLRVVHHDLDDDDACLTAQLVRAAGLAVSEGSQDTRPLMRLAKEFTWLYHVPLPDSARETYYPEPGRSAPESAGFPDKPRA